MRLKPAGILITLAVIAVLAYLALGHDLTK